MLVGEEGRTGPLVEPRRGPQAGKSGDPRSQNTDSRLADIKAEKYGPRLITLANLLYACRRRKRTNSSPNGRVPSSLTKFPPEERTACVMHQTIASSRTPGTRPDSEDSMPSTKPLVRLLLPCSFHYFLSLFRLLFLSRFKAFVRLDHTPLMHTSLNMYVHYSWGLLGQKLFIIIP